MVGTLKPQSNGTSVPADLECQEKSDNLLVIRGKWCVSPELCNCRDVTVFNCKSLIVEMNKNWEKEKYKFGNVHMYSVDIQNYNGDGKESV